ncbi:BatD family protein [Kangiella marina]|uniref:BatD family protein n=1 Tax=Kangiella marina TaxID=1079178 RepID=A0ABP8IF17_9GAMM
MTLITRILSSLLLLASITLSQSANAEITLSLDRSDVHENETFHLRVRVEDSSTLRAGANVNFIPEEITIRSRQEYNNSIVNNGKYITQMGWDFELLATSAGTYTIPALSIGNERSEPFTIRILPEQNDLGDTTNAKIKLRANLSDTEVYVQQQLIFTVRIYRSVVARNQQITPIRVTNALVEQLGDSKAFDVVKDGNDFRVVEQRYAIFPQQSGEMTIEPMTYSATVLEESQGRSPWQRSQLKPLSLSTQKYTVNVKPKPQNAAEPWLPATKLELEAEWQPKNQTFRVGDPANLDFIIKGTGLLKTQLPSVTFPEQQGVTIYRDTPQYRQRINRFGVNSYHFEKIAVIPSESGEITIPEIKVPWWNVKTDQQEYATLPAQTIQVQQSSKQITSDDNQTVIPQGKQIATQQEPEAQEKQTLLTNEQNYWKYITFALGILWLLTLFLLMRQKSQPAYPQASDLNQDRSGDDEALSASLKRAIKAAKANDPRATIQCLSAWLRGAATNVSATNIRQFIAFCESHELSDLAKELERLQQHCYSKQGNQSWKGQKLAHLLAGFKSSTMKNTQQRLPELYNTDR